MHILSVGERNAIIISVWLKLVYQLYRIYRLLYVGTTKQPTKKNARVTFKSRTYIYGKYIIILKHSSHKQLNDTPECIKISSIL